MAVRFLETTIYGGFVTWTPGALAAFVAEVLEQGTIYVAEVNITEGDGHRTQVVGMIALMARVHPLNHSTYGEELAWWVESGHRHGSIGDDLLGAAESWARVNRLSVLKVTAPAASRIGTAYERRGFTLVETTYQKVITP